MSKYCNYQLTYQDSLYCHWLLFSDYFLLYSELLPLPMKFFFKKNKENLNKKWSSLQSYISECWLISCVIGAPNLCLVPETVLTSVSDKWFLFWARFFFILSKEVLNWLNRNVTKSNCLFSFVALKTCF